MGRKLLYSNQTLIVMFAIFTSALGSQAQFEILWQNVNEMVPEYGVTLSCRVTDISSEEILAMTIGKDGKTPFATLRQCSDLTFEIGKKENFNIDGLLERNLSQSYIRVRIMNPTNEDAGTYKCQIVRLNKEGLLTEESIKASLTSADNSGANEIFKHFLNKTLHLEEIINDQQKTISDLKQKVKVQDSKVSENAERIGHVEDVTKNQIKRVEILNDKNNFMSAFTAAYSKNPKLKHGDKIVFGNVLMKEGNGYDGKSGIFTAPKAGFYVFHLIVTTAKTNDYFNIEIKANGKTQARLFAYDADKYAGQSSVSCTTRLQSGDRVWVTVAGSSQQATSLHSYSLYSIFTGYLVKEI